MRASLLLCLLVIAAAPPADAQARADESRLTIGVGLMHLSGGGQVWRVAGQPILGTNTSDTVDLDRHLTSSIGFTFNGAYFPSSYYGLTAEIVVTRLGSADDCHVVRAPAGGYTEGLCASVENHEDGTSTGIFSVGGVLRPGFRGNFQPFARAMGGMVVVQESFVSLEGITTNAAGDQAAAIIYRDEDVTTVSPYLALGAGFAAGISPGWQLRVELRDTYLRLPAITGPTQGRGLEPRRSATGHHLLSFNLSFDVLLERKRGRRY